MIHSKLRLCAVALLSSSLVCLAGFAAAAVADEEATPYDHLEWRNVGPVNMSGRVADVEGIPGDPNILYVGAASGGVWKTIDGGLSFEPIFDDQPIASIGDLALAPSNRDVIYVGTGEANVRNSVSFGNGVYKSTDGGQSWKHMGLDDTRHISRIVVHPTNPDIVYVGALGHIFGPNEDRGVFRSTDGGASWEKVLYLDDRHGVSDLDMVLTFRNLHNFNPEARAVMNKQVFKALKSGGLYGVVDHTRRHMEAHDRENRRRIDPVLVIKEMLEIGFEFVDYSDLHYRADDELEYEVGRRSVSGNTDRFTMLFRKP